MRLWKREEIFSQTANFNIGLQYRPVCSRNVLFERYFKNTFCEDLLNFVNVFLFKHLRITHFLDQTESSLEARVVGFKSQYGTISKLFLGTQSFSSLTFCSLTTVQPLCVSFIDHPIMILSPWRICKPFYKSYHQNELSLQGDFDLLEIHWLNNRVLRELAICHLHTSAVHRSR